ncbi:hypothetical protein HNR73_003670 [Phytomonospora endophytica]|uniref:Uncharacterized protein n=1 Tax=Phytomonospora endophytica TaxID=714109 RepID=A0A841FHW9_9ACTN|nr:hypothetical protein [Phytomonospora endophytica]
MGESRSARPPTPGTRPRFRTQAGDLAPAAGRSPIPYPSGGFVRAAQTNTGPYNLTHPTPGTQDAGPASVSGASPAAPPPPPPVTRLREREPPLHSSPGPGARGAASARESRFAAHLRPGTPAAVLSRQRRVSLHGSPHAGDRAAALPRWASLARSPAHAGYPAAFPQPGRGPGTGGGPQPDPMPARRFRSRRPNKHRPLQPHPPTPGTQDADPASVSLASRLTHAGDPAAVLSRPRRVSLRSPATPGTRHRRRAAARSHTRKAVSFAPPKQAQALKTSPTNTGNPRHAPAKRERRFACRPAPAPPVTRPASASPRFTRPPTPGTEDTAPRTPASQLPAHRHPGRTCLPLGECRFPHPPVPPPPHQISSRHGLAVSVDGR